MITGKPCIPSPGWQASCLLLKRYENLCHSRSMGDRMEFNPSSTTLREALLSLPGADANLKALIGKKVGEGLKIAQRRSSKYLIKKNSYLSLGWILS